MAITRKIPLSKPKKQVSQFDDFKYSKNSHICFLSPYGVAVLFPVSVIREMKLRPNSILVFVDMNLDGQAFPINKFNFSEYSRFIDFYFNDRSPLIEKINQIHY